jgi:hypothetical protein
MARLDKNKFLSGVIGNLVFRNLDGKQIVQSKPDKIKQSTMTKLSGSEFRSCSQWAKMIRQYLYNFLINQNDSYMYRRLTGSLYRAIRSNTAIFKGERTPLNSNLDELVGFDFNSNSAFKDYFLPTVLVVLTNERQVQVTLPEFKPKSEVVFPERTGHAELLVYVMTTSLKYNTAVVDDYFIVPMTNNATLIPATVWTSLILPESHFVLVTAKIMYYNNDKFTVKNYINSKAMNPSTILMAKHT